MSLITGRGNNMAGEDLKKFREMLLTDTDFQEKFRKAAESYTGEPEEKAIFDSLLNPLAQEYGLSASYEEFHEYIESFVGGIDGELSEDELAQVAGGKDGGGLAWLKCIALGVGAGGGGAMSDAPGGYYFGTGLCLGIGAGIGKVSCSGEGEAGDLF